MDGGRAGGLRPRADPVDGSRSGGSRSPRAQRRPCVAGRWAPSGQCSIAVKMVTTAAAATSVGIQVMRDVGAGPLGDGPRERAHRLPDEEVLVCGHRRARPELRDVRHRVLRERVCPGRHVQPHLLDRDEDRLASGTGEQLLRCMLEEQPERREECLFLAPEVVVERAQRDVRRPRDGIRGHRVGAVVHGKPQRGLAEGGAGRRLLAFPEADRLVHGDQPTTTLHGRARLHSRA